MLLIIRCLLAVVILGPGILIWFRYRSCYLTIPSEVRAVQDVIILGRTITHSHLTSISHLDSFQTPYLRLAARKPFGCDVTSRPQIEADVDVLRVKPNCVQLAVPLATSLVAPTNGFYLQSSLTPPPLALSSFH